MANIITGIISITIGAVILASVFITQLKGTNTSPCANASVTCSQTWSASEIALWGLISLLGIVGMLYGVLNVFGLA